MTSEKVTAWQIIRVKFTMLNKTVVYHYLHIPFKKIDWRIVHVHFDIIVKSFKEAYSYREQIQTSGIQEVQDRECFSFSYFNCNLISYSLKDYGIGIHQPTMFCLSHGIYSRTAIICCSWDITSHCIREGWKH